MKTAGLFEKNGNRWQPTGFETEYSHAYAGWRHNIYRDLYYTGGSGFSVKLGKAGVYIPVVYVQGDGVYEGEPARSLETAKKRALALALEHKILFRIVA